MGFKNIQEKIEEGKEKRNIRRQSLTNFEDIDLLLKGRDILTVQRTNYPECAPEDFLYINKDTRKLIVLGTGIDEKGEIYGRVLKLSLKEIQLSGNILIKDYESKFFELKERSFTILHDSGLLW